MTTRKNIKVSYIIQGNKEVPMIRIRGKWLHEAGFSISDKVELTIMKTGLIELHNLKERSEQ